VRTRVGRHARWIWETIDPDDRVVTLTFRRWRHILDRHRELRGQRRAVLQAVTDPHERLPGRRPDEEWFYGKETRRDRWIRVVVHYDGDRGFIVTAFPRRLIP
jgi:hypothetical protein